MYENYRMQILCVKRIHHKHCSSLNYTKHSVSHVADDNNNLKKYETSIIIKRKAEYINPIETGDHLFMSPH